MSEPAASQFYTVSMAARILDVSPSTVWRWIESAKLPAYRVGPKKIRIKKEDLEAVIKPVRAGREHASTNGGIVYEPPTRDELARRQALVAQILASRKECIIAPDTTAGLVRKVRDREKRSYASR